MESQISVEFEGEFEYNPIYSVIIDNKFFIKTTYVDAFVWGCYNEAAIKEWMRAIQRSYGKKKKQNLYVGLSAASRYNYSDNGTHNSKADRIKKMSFQLLQICVGSHCLLIELSYEALEGFPGILKDFLSHKRTVVVGVGIDQIADKIEKESDLLIPNRIDLRKEAVDKMFPGKKFDRHSLFDLANFVLGGEIVYVKPTKMNWYDEGFISDDIIKYATVEVFLASSMASKLFNRKF